MKLSAVSRAIAHALRHEPWLYGLELDDKGWVCLHDLITALRHKNTEWSELCSDHLHQIIDGSDKRRYEINGGRIRALYGHSMPLQSSLEPVAPTTILYHGTSPKNVVKILSDGLLPMDRQYVHLSLDQNTALEVGRRKSPTPVILEIDAVRMHSEGSAFYKGNDKVWLTKHVPAKYIKKL